LRSYAAFALTLGAVASSAHAQTDTDLALERLEAIDTIRAGILRPAFTLGLRDGPGSDDAHVSAAPSFGFALASLEKRGTAWEAFRLDHFRAWTHGQVDVAFTLLDLSQEMLGTDVDHDLCWAAFAVISHGDCQHGGIFGVRAEVLHHAYASESARWFHRWFELGGVFSFFGDSFDVDFVRARLPITLGASLDQIANVALPTGEASVRLRGLASLAGVVRFAGYRWELTGGVDYRPALAPFDFTDDYAIEARLKLSYVWLAALLGEIRSSAQRVYLEARGSHWQKPWLSEHPVPARDTVEITIGIELTLRSITPS
jgi:hypothetical protein